jgi:hypothetical protein
VALVCAGQSCSLPITNPHQIIAVAEAVSGSEVRPLPGAT